jgi:hypothetical protein
VKAWQIEPGDIIVFSDGMPAMVEWIEDRTDSITFHCYTRAKRCVYSDEVEIR